MCSRMIVTTTSKYIHGCFAISNRWTVPVPAFSYIEPAKNGMILPQQFQQLSWPRLDCWSYTFAPAPCLSKRVGHHAHLCFFVCSSSVSVVKLFVILGILTGVHALKKPVISLLCLLCLEYLIFLQVVSNQASKFSPQQWTLVSPLLASKPPVLADCLHGVVQLDSAKKWPVKTIDTTMTSRWLTTINHHKNHWFNVDPGLIKLTHPLKINKV